MLEPDPDAGAPPREQLRAIDVKLGELDKRSLAKQELVTKCKAALTSAEEELAALQAERAGLSAERTQAATLSSECGSAVHHR